MSAPAGPERDGLYSQLIEEEDFNPGYRHTASPVRASQPQRGPVLTLGLYRASVAALAALCVILLICVIAVSTHKQAAQSGAEQTPQTERRTQEFNVTQLQSEIGRLKEENRRMWAELNATKAVQPTAPPPQCPVDWLSFNGSCFLVSRRSRSWSDAQEFCVSLGAHLAIILTAEEQTFVWNLLPRGHWNAFWIGITDAHTEDQWHWVDGTPLVGGFWEEGEPNNHIDEDCGYIVKTRVLERVAIRSWYDAPCSMNWPFVCERPKRPGTAGPTARSN
uniref:C-type lectin domain-containing protein n=1 Tax=Neogobius melanostomus TaxID=47308 RepID=A0A8C6TVA5_9GOBI